MKPVFEAAKRAPQRLVYAEGEESRVLHAVQTVVDEGIAHPILVGRPAVIEQRIAKLGLRIRAGEHFELVNPESDPRYPRILERISSPDAAARRHAGFGQARDAQAQYPDCGDAGAHGRGGCDAVRDRFPAAQASALYR